MKNSFAFIISNFYLNSRAIVQFGRRVFNTLIGFTYKSAAYRKRCVGERLVARFGGSICKNSAFEVKIFVTALTFCDNGIIIIY